jgi:hypothetical protein
MLISEKHHFLFVHNYKTAGVSLTEALLPFAFDNPLGYQAFKALRKLKISPPKMINPQPYPKHISALQLIEKLGEETYKTYFSFSFVRNPWDWQVSLYNFMLKDPGHRQNAFIKSMKDFNEYIHWRCAEEVRLQKDFVYLPGDKPAVDLIGKYENLTGDFAVICQRIGISATLPWLNVSRTKPYQEYYTPETIELVRKTFAPDIAIFGYDFA